MWAFSKKKLLLLCSPAKTPQVETINKSSDEVGKQNEQLKTMSSRMSLLQRERKIYFFQYFYNINVSIYIYFYVNCRKVLEEEPHNGERSQLTEKSKRKGGSLLT